MNDNYIYQQVFSDIQNKLLTSLSGDILSYNISGSQDMLNYNLDIENFIQILKFPINKPIIRLTVLNRDESIDYVIPNEDIVQDSISYNEKYTNGQRKDLSFKLINIEKEYGSQQEYKYMPNVNGLWYNTKIKYEQGFEYQGVIFYFEKGIFVINNFELSHGTGARDILYQCTDKFGAFEGPLGTLEDGYEIPVGTPVNDVINDMLNMSCPDGYIVDPKPPIIDSKYFQFKTQSTIRVDAGGTMGSIFEQLGTQMSAEYYYNNTGNLSFYPINDSMNDIDKPIIWTYNELNTDNLSFQGQDEIVNVVKVIGTNVDNKIYTYVAKNTNLNSPINIYRIRERKTAPIESPNIWSEEMAKELAEYNLRKHMILTFNYSLTVPYNPLLLNNTVVELYNTELNIEKARFLINGIQYTSGSAQMQIDITNISDLSFIGGVASGR